VFDSHTHTKGREGGGVNDDSEGGGGPPQSSNTLWEIHDNEKGSRELDSSQASGNSKLKAQTQENGNCYFQSAMTKGTSPQKRHQDFTGKKGIETLKYPIQTHSSRGQCGESGG